MHKNNVKIIARSTGTILCFEVHHISIKLSTMPKYCQKPYITHFVSHIIEEILGMHNNIIIIVHYNS